MAIRSFLKHREVSGVTLIELIVVIALIAVVGGVLLVMMNPTGLFARARNSERRSHLNVMVNAIKENIADNRTGVFSCTIGDIPTTTVKRMTSDAGAGNYNIGPCLVPVYLTNLPFDPATTSARYVSVTDYDTAYTVTRNATTGEVTVRAPAAELGENISISR